MFNNFNRSSINTDNGRFALFMESPKKLYLPRFYGTHPRILGRYVREKSYLSLECAIQKMTNMPATRLGLKNRGTIERNYMADLVVFDPDKIVDTATFDDPHNLAEGISYVIVGGEIVVSKGKHTNAKPGRVLRRGE